MTTTVCDFVNRVVASDSRWSVKLDPYGYFGHVAFVDDTGFGKLSIRGDIILCLAGEGALIELWKMWWKAPVLHAEYPPVESETGAVVIYAFNMKTNELEFNSQLSCVHLDPQNRQLQAVFSGSGETAALANWQSSKCAISSIEIAKEFDVCTGGTVRFVNLKTNAINIEDTVDNIASVVTQLQQRGYVMNVNDPNKTQTPLAEFDAKTIGALAANGVLKLSAPCGNEAVVWDAAAKSRLSGFVNKVIAAESAVTD